jgi:hypothetical protein
MAFRPKHPPKAFHLKAPAEDMPDGALPLPPELPIEGISPEAPAEGMPAPADMPDALPLPPELPIDGISPEAPADGISPEAHLPKACRTELLPNSLSRCSASPSPRNCPRS